MRVLRFLLNVLLAIILISASAVVLFTGYGVVVSKAWEYMPLDTSVDEGSWVTIDNQAIHYRTWEPDQNSGANPSTIILIHGFEAGGLQTWTTSAPAWARLGMRVIAVDLRGFGYSARDSSPTYSVQSQARLVAQVLQQLEVARATVVGHGWGCAVALQLAQDQPQQVQRLVLLAPFVYRDPLVLCRQASRVPYLGRATAWAITSGDPFWTFLRRRGLYDPAAVSNAQWDALRQPTHIVGTISSVLAMAASPEPSRLLEGALPPVSTLILVGREDAYVPLEEVQRLETALPSARLVVLPEAGHYLHLEQSAIVNRAVADFASTMATR